MKLSEVAQVLGASLLGSSGDEEIFGVAGIQDAQPGQLTFLANKRYASHVQTTRASALILDPGYAQVSVPTLRIANPYLAFAHALELFYSRPTQTPGIHPTAVVHPTARIGAHASIGPYAVIAEHVILGDHATLYPYVTLYPHVVVGDRFVAHSHVAVREYCQIGNDVVLQNGAIIGADGFGFARQNEPEQAVWHKIVQSGPAILEDDVEVQANSCIDRASIGVTRIGRGAKIDNLVQVGHGSSVGPNTLLCAQVGLAGSTIVGRDVTLAGQVGVAGHCTIGDGVIATAQSGIPNDVVPGQTVSGYPAVENRRWLRSVALFHRLPELLAKIRHTS